MSPKLTTDLNPSTLRIPQPARAELNSARSMSRVAMAVAMAVGGWSGSVLADDLPFRYCVGADCTISTSMTGVALPDGAAGEQGEHGVSATAGAAGADGQDGFAGFSGSPGTGVGGAGMDGGNAVDGGDGLAGGNATLATAGLDGGDGEDVAGPLFFEFFAGESGGAVERDAIGVEGFEDAVLIAVEDDDGGEGEFREIVEAARKRDGFEAALASGVEEENGIEIGLGEAGGAADAIGAEWEAVVFEERGESGEGGGHGVSGWPSGGGRRGRVRWFPGWS